jgi:hypothetical protein
MPANNKRICQFPGCGAIGVFSKELCHKHYARMMRSKPDDPSKPRCIAPGCQTKVHAKSLCQKHYERMKRRGELEPADLRYTASPVIDGKKICRLCNIAKDLSEFSIDSRSDSCLAGRQGWCKECTRNYQNTRRYSRTENGVCTNCDNPVVAGSTFCENHTNKKQKYWSSPIGRANQLLRAAGTRARDCGVDFTLNLEWALKKLKGNCEMTGLPFDLESGGKKGKYNPYAPSIDRKIPGSHYTPENCRMVLIAINIAVNAWGEEIYRKIARAHLKHLRESRERSGAGKDLPLVGNLLMETNQSDSARNH